jgi:hypothetical protein
LLTSTEQPVGPSRRNRHAIESSIMKIQCQKNHSGSRNLTRHMGGWECDGCGAHYVSLVVEAKPGMTPFATETTIANARKSSAEALRIGLTGRIIPV